MTLSAARFSICLRPAFCSRRERRRQRLRPRACRRENCISRLGILSSCVSYRPHTSSFRRPRVYTTSLSSSLHGESGSSHAAGSALCALGRRLSRPRPDPCNPIPSFLSVRRRQEAPVSTAAAFYWFEDYSHPDWPVGKEGIPLLGCLLISHSHPRNYSSLAQIESCEFATSA